VGKGTGNKFRISLALPVAAVMNCADNTGSTFVQKMSRSHGAEEGTKVYLGNLDERTTKRDVEEFLKNHGPIVDLWLARSPPGFGFVRFEHPRDAEDAVKDLDGLTLLGRRVRCEISRGTRSHARDEKCYECGRYGHFARECRDRRRSRSRGRDRSRDRSRDRRRARSRSRSRSRSGSRGRRRPSRDRRSRSRSRSNSRSASRGRERDRPKSPETNGTSAASDRKEDKTNKEKEKEEKESAPEPENKD